MRIGGGGGGGGGSASAALLNHSITPKPKEEGSFKLYTELQVIVVKRDRGIEIQILWLITSNPIIIIQRKFVTYLRQ